MAVPTAELMGGPRERFVQMAEVAGIRPSGCEFVCDPGTAHLVAANRLQDAVSGMGHVTVVALTPAGRGQVMCVADNLRFLAESLVTLSAGSVAGPIPGQLTVGVAFMQRVTGETGKPATAVAGRFDQSVVIPAGDANHAVRPEEVAQYIRVPRKKIGETGDLGRLRGADDRSGGFQIVTRPVAKSAFGPAFVAVPPFHGMAKAADLRSPDGIDLLWMDDLAPQGLRVGRGRFIPLCGLSGLEVALSGPMACFAGNSQFANPRVHRAGFAVGARFNSG